MGAALSIPNGDLFFLGVDSEHTTKTIANEVEWKECKLEASDDTVPLRIHVTKIETDDTVDAVLITTERHDYQKTKADILKTKNKNKNFTENILNYVSSDVDELTKHARSFMEVTGVEDLDRAKRFVQNAKNEVDKAVMEYFSNPNATPPPLHNRRKSINQSLIVLTKAEADAMRKEEAGVANGGLNMYQCLDCESKNCTSFQMQTRGAGEPMTVFCSCLDCGVSFIPNGGGYDGDEPPTLPEDPEGSKNHFNLKILSQEALTAALKATKAKL